MAKPTIVDLFCGGGGFGLGAELAGFRSEAAIDIDVNLQAAYRLNFPNTRVFTQDIGALDETTWHSWLAGSRPDGVIGGPPCQGFSRIGKRQAGDPRNSLIGHFFRNIRLLRPKFFIMENVEGLLDSENVTILEDALADLNGTYKIVGPMMINAANFGAPTKRKRVIVVGFNPEEMEVVSERDFEPLTKLGSVTVRDAIGDLAQPVASKSGDLEFGWSRISAAHSEDKLSSYARKMRRAPPSHLGWQISTERQERGEISGFMETRHSEEVQARFAQTKPGGVEATSRYPRLDWDGLCPTLRAGTGPEKGSFQSMRPIHPSEHRVITVREAARLQGFPDWFTFSRTKWHSFRMIGNSVSPIVSQKLLSVMREKLFKPQRSQFEERVLSPEMFG